MADPVLNEILRRAIYGQAVQAMSPGFAPQPITFAAPGNQVPTLQQTGGTPAGGMPAGVMPGQEGPGMPIGNEPGVGGAPGGGFGFGSLGGFGSGSIVGENAAIGQAPFGLGPVTPADVIGFGANLMAPLPVQIASMIATGRGVGSNVKGALTPVETAMPVSVEAFGLAGQLGVSPEEAQSLITTLGLEGVPVTGPTAAPTGGVATPEAVPEAVFGAGASGPGDVAAPDGGPDASVFGI